MSHGRSSLHMRPHTQTACTSVAWAAARAAEVGAGIEREVPNFNQSRVPVGTHDGRSPYDSRIP